jgi:hypothetical protein
MLQRLAAASFAIVIMATASIVLLSPADAQSDSIVGAWGAPVRHFDNGDDPEHRTRNAVIIFTADGFYSRFYEYEERTPWPSQENGGAAEASLEQHRDSITKTTINTGRYSVADNQITYHYILARNPNYNDFESTSATFSVDGDTLRFYLPNANRPG